MVNAQGIRGAGEIRLLQSAPSDALKQRFQLCEFQYELAHICLNRPCTGVNAGGA